MIFVFIINSLMLTWKIQPVTSLFPNKNPGMQQIASAVEIFHLNKFCQLSAFLTINLVRLENKQYSECTILMCFRGTFGTKSK